MRKEVRLIIIMGNNNTGKSVVAKSIIDSWIIKNPNGYVAAFDPQNRFDQKNINVKTDEDLRDLSSMKNSLIVFDDFRKIHKKERPADWLIDLMADRYENGLDLIFIFHGPKQLIEFLTTYEDLYLIFYTNYKEKDLYQRFPEPDIISKTMDIITHEYRNNGQGEYPTFPHCMVEVNENLITKINFKDSPDYGKKISII